VAACYVLSMPTSPVTRPSFTKELAARVLDVRVQHILDLVNRRFLAPSVSPGRRGPRGHRLFNICDLVAIRSAQELTQLGFVGRRLRRVCRHIRQIERSGEPLASLLITAGGTSVHVQHGEAARLLRHVERPFGHLVLDLERVSKWVRQAIRETLGPSTRRGGRRRRR